MFSKLKEKLKNWAKKISEKTEEKTSSKLSEDKEKVEIKQAEKKTKKLKEKIHEEKKEPDLEKIEKPVLKEIEMPTKFNVGLEIYEPDLEKLEEIKKDAEEETELKEESPEKKSFFNKIKVKFYSTEISKQDFDEYSEELEMLLVENNVALEVAEKIIKDLEKKIVGKEISKNNLEKEINENLKEIIKQVLIEPFDLIERIKRKKEKPYVILFCGINGSGKTTTIAKLASKLKKHGLSCVIAAGDTFRAASIEQIKKHGEKLGIKVISNDYGSDPASVGFDTISYAKKHLIDCVLIDTAGRMHTAKNLLKEIEKISKVCKPDTKIFVGESITGNDSIEQVRSFDSAIEIDGIILSKADVDEKGGTALSLGYITRKPILYLGMGQEYEDLEEFDKKKILEKIGL
jgi:fused signal recognition particle receptor